MFMLLYLWQLASPVELKIVPDVHEMQGCPGFDIDMDFSNVNFDFDDDGYLIVDGNFTILEDIADPYPLFIHSDRIERGEWSPTFITKPIRNFCDSVLDPMEVWYPVTKQLKDLKCPFSAGHIITFDNIKYKFPVNIPPKFLGEWRFIVEHRDILRDPKALHCLMQHVTVIEI